MTFYKVKRKFYNDGSDSETEECVYMTCKEQYSGSDKIVGLMFNF